MRTWYLVPGTWYLVRKRWWAREDSNLQPIDYEPTALTVELRARLLLLAAVLLLLIPTTKAMVTAGNRVSGKSESGKCQTQEQIPRFARNDNATTGRQPRDRAPRKGEKAAPWESAVEAAGYE